MLLMLSLGVSMHLLLDAVFQGVIIPFYPFSDFSIGLNLFSGAFAGTMAAGIDAILLILWLVYIELRHKVSDFI